MALPPILVLALLTAELTVQLELLGSSEPVAFEHWMLYTLNEKPIAESAGSSQE